ncbi:MAG: DUF6933 domain-containing protein [Actinophytocola sp.]|uniref:DUF6933 domain-containing protein n=1 Tax=Actinophytocola sp. TaxID=1872138 RepID=UPI003D6AE0B7
MPLAPAATLTSRIAEHLITVLSAHHAPAAIMDQERRHMRTCQLGATTNRSVVGVMPFAAATARRCARAVRPGCAVAASSRAATVRSE